MAGAAIGWSVVFWFTVTVHAPTHGQALILINNGHRLHRSVTGVAIFPRLDVGGVIELHVIREKMHFLPSDGLAIVVSFSEFLNVRTVGFDHHVTVHADIETGNGSVARLLHAGVTVLTVHLVSPRVQIVGKGDGLIRHVTLIVTNHDLIS